MYEIQIINSWIEVLYYRRTDACLLSSPVVGDDDARSDSVQVSCYTIDVHIVRKINTWFSYQRRRHPPLHLSDGNEDQIKLSAYTRC